MNPYTLLFAYPLILEVWISWHQWILLKSLQYIWWLISDWHLRRNLWIIRLSSVYHHPQVSRQDISIHIVISISMAGLSIHFIAPMDLIVVTTISGLTNFRPKCNARPVNNSIEDCLSPPPSVWKTWIHPHIHLHIHWWLEYVFHSNNGNYWHDNNSFVDSFQTDIWGATYW